ncbi:hypothetical protein JVU11DRAFT_432 [Chiua virens]|nr:hypothetical protein JVU11DRAFT_432 [Chiua virens]
MFLVCIPISSDLETQSAARLRYRPTEMRAQESVPDVTTCSSRTLQASMFAAKSRTWFELCFVPLIPFKSRKVWMCGICQLQTDMQPGWAPPLAQPGYQHPGPSPGLPGPPPQNYGKGYQPGYIQG